MWQVAKMRNFLLVMESVLSADLRRSTLMKAFGRENLRERRESESKTKPSQVRSNRDSSQEYDRVIFAVLICVHLRKSAARYSSSPRIQHGPAPCSDSRANWRY